MILELRSSTFFSVQSPNIWLKVYFNLKKFGYGAGTGMGRVMPILIPIPVPYPFLTYPPHTHFFSIFHTHTH